MFLKPLESLLIKMYNFAMNYSGLTSSHLDVYFILVTLASILSVLLIFYVTFKMEKNRLFFGFLFLLTMMAFWIYADLQKYVNHSPGTSLAWFRTEHLIRLYAAISWYIFSEVYTKRREKINSKIIILLLLSAPIVFLVFSFQHFNVDSIRVFPESTLQTLFFYLLTFYLTILSIFRLNRYAIRQKGVFVKQVQLITAGEFFVIIIDVLTFIGLIKLSFDLIPIAFLMFEFFIWKAITKYRLMDVIPVALREVFNNMSDGVIVLNEDGSIIDVNNAASKYIGKFYNPKIDITIYDIIMNLSTKIDDSAVLLGEVKKSLHRTNSRIHTEIMIKESPRKYFSFSLGPIYNNRKRTIGFLVAIDDITENKKLIIQNEEQNLKLQEQNEELEAQKEELEAQKDELMDVNRQLEQAYTELQETQSQLVQTEKMAALGQLVAGVAHEINTPLGSINSNIEITRLIASKLSNSKTIEYDEEIIKLIDKFNKMNEINSIACKRILEIVRSLKNFSRLDEADFQKANIHDGLDSTLILLNNQLKNRITIHKSYGSIPEIECYPNQLNQVFMNLLVNASQAIENTGDIYINTYSENEYAIIEIIDSGKGIKAQHLSKVFDPGFTTKGVGVGTGLGLSICYKIIQKHNGTISVENVEDLGAKFIIRLPINNKNEVITEKEV